MSETVREFIEKHHITAKLCFFSNIELEGKRKEFFIDQDSYLTLEESEACVYEPQDLDELIDQGETLTSVLSGVHAVFYAEDGGNMEGWIPEEEIDEEIPEDHFLMELI